MECRREPVLMTYFRGRWEARCSYLRFAQPRRYPSGSCRRNTMFPAPLYTRWVLVLIRESRTRVSGAIFSLEEGRSRDRTALWKIRILHSESAME